MTPVTATRKPVVFCELSVGPTINQLVHEHPQFLRCRELTEACRSAAWVSCSIPFFAQVCKHLTLRVTVQWQAFYPLTIDISVGNSEAS